MIRDIINHYYEEDMDNLHHLSDNIVDELYNREVTPAEMYQICFKYKKVSDFEEDTRDNVGAVFDKYIDREEETKLQILGKMSNTMTSGGGIRRRKKGRNNPFGITRDNDEYRESNVDHIADKDSGSDLSAGRNIKLRDISDTETDKE
jgi:hypothetical protein